MECPHCETHARTMNYRWHGCSNVSIYESFTHDIFYPAAFCLSSHFPKFEHGEFWSANWVKWQPMMCKVLARLLILIKVLIGNLGLRMRHKHPLSPSQIFMQSIEDNLPNRRISTIELSWTANSLASVTSTWRFIHDEKNSYSDCLIGTRGFEKARNFGSFLQSFNAACGRPPSLKKKGFHRDW